MQSERVPNLYRSLKGAVWERRVAILIGSLLTVAIFIVYWQVRSYDFVVMDDLVYVSDNPHVLTGFTSQNVGWAFTTFHAGFWIPLTWLSFMVDAQIAALEPARITSPTCCCMSPTRYSCSHFSPTRRANRFAARLSPHCLPCTRSTLNPSPG